LNSGFPVNGSTTVQLKEASSGLRFFTPDYFQAVEESLSQSVDWIDESKDLDTTVLFTASDLPRSFLLTVKNRESKIREVGPQTQADFSFEGMYELWVKIARGELRVEPAILTGKLKFKGSWFRLLQLRNKLDSFISCIRLVQAEV